MNSKPLLLLPTPTRAKQPPGNSCPPTLHVPSNSRQFGRTAPQFQALQQSFGELQPSAAGVSPEHVVVLEIFGSVTDFYVAVKNTKGMDWLGEWDIDDLDPDDDFFDKDNKSAKLPGRLFLVMSSRKAIDQLISLHKKWKLEGDGVFTSGRTKWRDVFKRLKTVRRWNAQDRLRETGLLEVWEEDLPLQTGSVRFEAELFFRDDQIKRNRAYRAFDQLVTSQGGRCVDNKVYKEIAYHGVVVELPVAGVQGILPKLREGQLDDVVLFRSEEVMFFRPLGQGLVARPSSNTSAGATAPITSPLPSGPPLVAVFDGMPLANHPALRDRVVVNDTDGFEDGYLAEHRVHGTEMASLVVHGDLRDRIASLSRPVYLRPIFKLDNSDPESPRETIPTAVLPADITYRAVKEMLDGDAVSDPAAPTVRIINMSIGDRARQYDGFVSPWARMLDWLAVKYRVLFLVSAGNHYRDVELPFNLRDVDQLSPEALEGAVLRAYAADLRHRRLLSPAESINAVTVGGLHADACDAQAMGYRKNPYTHRLPAVYSAVGFGHRNGLKPELWVPGGRQFCTVRCVSGNGRVVLKGVDHPVEPGHLVAGPSGKKGEKSPVRFTRGTSAATALASHQAGLIAENLLSLRDQPHGDIIEDRYIGVLTKALLAHGATWGEAYDVLKAALKGNRDEAEFNRQIARFLGYGVPDCDRALGCTSSRATLLGCGSLRDGEAQRFEIPLPPSLGGRKVHQRVIITLAWFSPVDAAHRNYRKAALWASKPEGRLKLQRENADQHACQRGTLQHDVYESRKAVPIVEGDNLVLQVNCQADAGKLTESVPYAIAVTLEVMNADDIHVYGEVQAALRARAAAAQARV